MGSYRGPLDPAAHRGVAPHPGAIFRKCSTLEPRRARAVSKHVRDTTLGLEGTEGRGGPGKKTEANPQTKHLSLDKGEKVRGSGQLVVIRLCWSGCHTFSAFCQEGWRNQMNQAPRHTRIKAATAILSKRTRGSTRPPAISTTLIGRVGDERVCLVCRMQ